MLEYANKIQLKLNTDIIDGTVDDSDVIYHYPQLKWIKSWKYYLHKYPDDYYFCYNYVFKDILLNEIDEAYEKLSDEYIPILKENARKGDIISFHKIDLKEKDYYEKQPSSMNCEHFAIISNIFILKNEQNKIKKIYINIKSKWGVMGVFEGDISDLPKSYGNKYLIWRKK